MKKNIISVVILASAALLGISKSYAAVTAGAAAGASAQYPQIIQVTNLLADTRGDEPSPGVQTPVVITYIDTSGASCFAPPDSQAIKYQNYDNVVNWERGCRNRIKEIFIDPQPLYGPGSPVAYAPIKVTINPKNDPNITTTQIIIYQDSEHPPVWSDYQITEKGKVLVLQQEK